jgi:hypothetical protein
VATLTPFHLLVLAVAVFRATRLVSRDEITDAAREWLRRSHDIDDAEVTAIGRVARFAFDLVSCPWCVSIWLGGLAVGLFLSYPSITLDVAYVLACSAVAGVVSERT